MTLEARNYETVTKPVGTLLIGAVILLLAALALQFFQQRSAAQDDRVRIAACALATELAAFRSEHLSPEALSLSPKPPLAAETSDVAKAFKDVTATSLPSRLGSLVAELQSIRRDANLTFADLNYAVPGDGRIGAAIAALGELEMSARSVVQDVSYSQPCDSGNT
jgi:hypothetical protein